VNEDAAAPRGLRSRPSDRVPGDRAVGLSEADRSGV